MASVNKVILLGHLGRDPELRYTPSGMAVCNFTMATSSGGGRDREQQTEWHRIVVFDKQAEFCNQYLAKGRQAYVEGRIQTRQFDDKQTGQKRTTTEIVASQVVFLGGAGGAGGAPGGGAGGAGSRGPARGGQDYDQGGYSQAPRGGGQGRGGYEPPGGDEMPPQSYPEDDDIPF